jgi:hypothetical protein
MTFKVAYFQPVIVTMDDVPAVEFSRIFSLAENLHSQPALAEPDHPLISRRGGQQIQVYPNKMGLDVNWLVNWLTKACEGYMELVSQQSGTEDLRLCQPVINSIWTIRQNSGDYQEIHSHPGGNLSGNIYISAPELIENSPASDGQIAFRLPQTRDVSRFIMQDTWKYAPTPGTYLIFPSHIPHTVYPWKGIGHRTVMAFDAKLIPKE